MQPRVDAPGSVPQRLVALTTCPPRPPPHPRPARLQQPAGRAAARQVGRGVTRRAQGAGEIPRGEGHGRGERAGWRRCEGRPGCRAGHGGQRESSQRSAAPELHCPAWHSRWVHVCGVRGVMRGGSWLASAPAGSSQQADPVQGGALPGPPCCPRAAWCAAPACRLLGHSASLNQNRERNSLQIL